MNKNYPPVRVTISSDDVVENIPKTRGRPRNDIIKTVQVNIKMTKEQRRRFKMAAAFHDVDYADLLERALDALEFVNQDE